MANERVVLEMTVEQAGAVSRALDFMSRMGIGQIEELAWLIRCGEVPVRSDFDKPRVLANQDQLDQIESLCHAIKDVLGFPRNGSNGIGNPHNSKDTLRSWEVKKILDRALAMHRNPNPDFRGVNYDGLIVRYTDDPLAEAKVVPSRNWKKPRKSSKTKS